MTPTTVTRMHSVLTQRGVSLAPATLATLEMVSLAQVRPTSNSCKCMGVNREVLQPHAVYEKLFILNYSTTLYLQISMSVD